MASIHDLALYKRTRRDKRLIHELARYGRTKYDELKACISANPSDIDLQYNGQTALTLAYIYLNTTSSLETIKLLVESGCDLDFQSNHGRTLLHRVCCELNDISSYKLVKLLIENGATLDLQDNDGRTALNIICWRSEKSWYDNFFVRGRGFVPKHMYKFKIIKMLIKNGATLDLQDIYGRTALTNIDSYNPSIVKLLVDSGCDLELRDMDGKDGVEICMDKGIDISEYRFVGWNRKVVGGGFV